MVVYVDDILIFSPSSDLVKEVMLKLQDKFKCKALGDVSFYLGLHIERDVEKRCMRVHQRKYLEALVANFGQSEGHVATHFLSGFKCVKGPEEESVGEEERRRFHSLVGSLMYAAANMRPDVAFATGQLARGGKLTPKTQLCAFISINTDFPGYLFYASSSQQLICSQDVIFDETRSPFLTPPPTPHPPSFRWSDFDPLPSTAPSPSPLPLAPAPPPLPAPSTPPSAVISGTSPPASSTSAPMPSPSQHPSAAIHSALAPPPSPRLTRSMTRAMSNFKHSALFTLLSPSRNVDLLEDRFEELFSVHPFSPLLCVTFGDFSNSPTLLSIDTAAIPTPQTFSEAVSGFHATEWMAAIIAKLYILAYVDDLVLLAEDSADLATVKLALQARLLCKDLGELRHYVGMEIHLSTPLPANHQLTAPAVSAPSSELRPYPELVGSLMYAMMCTLPDLAYPLSILSRFVGLGRHSDVHWAAAKRVLCYLRATSDLALTLGGSSPPILSGYSDSSYADSRPDRLSSQGYGFTLGSGLISWRSTRSSSVCLSTYEAELYAGTLATQEALYLSFLLAELGQSQPSVTLSCDSASMIHLMENRVYHARSKDIEVAATANLADIFTKALLRVPHRFYVRALGLTRLATSGGMGLVLGGRQPVVLTSHCDSSYADDMETQRSPQAYCFSLGDGAVSWRSTRSSSTASSSVEAEIYAGAMAAEEFRWFTFLLADLGEQPRSTPTLFADNKAMILLCREP
ncbi:unnamed protein product [Closterium sp. NIES-53]